MEIQTIADLQALVLAGETDWRQYGDVNHQIEDDLILFNYNQQAQFAHRWNVFERISRGLILNRKTGEIVARPFDKFFNWLENGEKAAGHIVTITEKMDGSLGILYRQNGAYKIATRGSLHSEQGIWATQFLARYDLADLTDEYTLLFEIIYPDNRVVVDYQGREDLVLLAIRNRFTGEHLPFFPAVYELASQFGFSVPPTFNFSNIADIIARCGELAISHEGYVVEFSDGSRWKFKGDRYLELHKLINSITWRNTVRAMADGQLDNWLQSLPDEFLTEVRVWQQEIEDYITETLNSVQEAFEKAPKETRKDFALWVQKIIVKERQPLFFCHAG